MMSRATLDLGSGLPGTDFLSGVRTLALDRVATGSAASASEPECKSLRNSGCGSSATHRQSGSTRSMANRSPVFALAGQQRADGFIELFSQDVIHGDSSPGSSKSQAREIEVADRALAASHSCAISRMPRCSRKRRRITWR